MTVEECYANMHGNYKDVKSRLASDKLIARIMVKFPKDKTMMMLRDAVKAGDTKTAFESAHAMKGVIGNLGFSELYQTVWDLTEQLRPQTEPADPKLVERVEEAYTLVVDNIAKFEAQ